MVQKLDLRPETASQTAGPFVHIGCMPRLAGLGAIYPQDIGDSPVAPGAQGQPITITGAVFDGTRWALRDAMLESWQADAQGRYPGQADADPAVSGFCRFATDPQTGIYSLRTVKPGPVAGRDGQVFAPQIALWIVARGINIGLTTRIFFEDEQNDADPLLARIEQRPRVETLLARRVAQGTYRFDIRLQGADETVFFDL